MIVLRQNHGKNCIADAQDNSAYSLHVAYLQATSDRPAKACLPIKGKYRASSGEWNKSESGNKTCSLDDTSTVPSPAQTASVNSEYADNLLVFILRVI